MPPHLLVMDNKIGVSPMLITVEGQHLEVGNAFRDHAEVTISEIGDRHGPRAIEASVTLAREGRGFRVALMLHAKPNLEFQSSAEGNDAYSAFDRAAQRLDKQMRRHKRRALSARRDTEARVAPGAAPTFP